MNADPADVDATLAGILAPEDDALRAATARADAAGLPGIAVSALQGRFLGLLTAALGATRVLELGTLGGYSTICLARALPADGRLLTIELDPAYAAVARENVDAAGVGERVEIRVGPALDVLPGVDETFDLAFLDADKATMARQLELVIPRVRRGGVIICDNVVRAGAVAAPSAFDTTAAGARAAVELLAADARVEASVVQTVGAKGHDGFAFARVR